MDVVMLDLTSDDATSDGFPVDEYAMVAGASRTEVSVHVFRVPCRPDGTHDFLYEHVRCLREDVRATAQEVRTTADGIVRTFALGPDLGPLQIDLSADQPYGDRDEVAAFVADHLERLRTDTRHKQIPRLVLRTGTDPEVLIDPRSIVAHDDGLFRIGHGWLIRWDDVADLSAAASTGNAADLRIYATDGRCVVLRLDLI